VSPDSNARSDATYSNIASNGMARCPMAMRAVYPVPKHARKRPLEIRWMVAMPAAIAITERWVGIRTAVARPMREVRAAARARCANGSSQSGAESKIHTRA
jgi:hypothetical protein